MDRRLLYGSCMVLMVFLLLCVVVASLEPHAGGVAAVAHIGK